MQLIEVKLSLIVWSYEVKELLSYYLNFNCKIKNAYQHSFLKKKCVQYIYKGVPDSPNFHFKIFIILQWYV